jgi:hypothetical protein
MCFVLLKTTMMCMCRIICLKQINGCVESIICATSCICDNVCVIFFVAIVVVVISNTSR